MEAAVDRLEVKVIQAEGLRGTESGPPSAYAEVRNNLLPFSALFFFLVFLLCSALFFFMNEKIFYATIKCSILSCSSMNRMFYFA